MAQPVSTLETMASFLPARYRPHAIKIAIGFVVGSAALVAVGATYTSYRSQQEAAINNELTAMKEAIYEGDLVEAATHFEFVKGNGTSLQTNVASLYMAFGHFENKEYDAAEQLYQEIIDNGETNSMKDTARLRFAKVLLSQGKVTEAQDTLINIESRSDNLELLTESLVGDIHLLENNLEQAHEAYSRAEEIAENLGDPKFLELLATRKSMAVSLMMQQGVPGSLGEKAIEVLLPDQENNVSQQDGQDSN